jgi:DNA (cytosine-5)-methyltransferase 1
MNLKVVELFAGVGGFRIGFEKANKIIGDKNIFDVIWSNQWEPNEKGQFASKVYEKIWGDKNHSNEDIAKVSTKEIPECDMLVGGFPCQDYSVAKTLNLSQGITGKKGVLWWEIYRITAEKKPPYLILENVDRLLGSPASQRGRDFAIILASLNDLGYIVEWRIINAAEYGFPQKRKRIFICAYQSNNCIGEKAAFNKQSWVTQDGIIARAFPITISKDQKQFFNFKIDGELSEISDNFGSPKKSLFLNTGISISRDCVTFKSTPNFKGRFINLGDILLPDNLIPKEYIIDIESIPKWKYLKGAKSLIRTKKNGIQYSYDEGAMSFPDAKDKPARTIITGEGGASASRFKHVVSMEDSNYRRLLPIELERLNGFPDNHTSLNGISEIKRAFFMGNALVTGVITKLAISYSETLDEITTEKYETNFENDKHYNIEKVA